MADRARCTKPVAVATTSELLDELEARFVDAGMPFTASRLADLGSTLDRMHTHQETRHARP